MMIYCPECENECSDKAPACPKCGHPLQSQPVQFTPIEQLQQATQQQQPQQPTYMNQQPVQTTQQTSKVWKFGMLVSGLAMLVIMPTCIVSIAVTEAADDNTAFHAGLILAFFGAMVTFIVCRLAAWWFHG